MANIVVLLLVIALAVTAWTFLEKKRRVVRDAESERARLRHVIAMDAKATPAYAALGDSLRNSGRLPEARTVYMQGLESCQGGGWDTALRDKIRHIDQLSPLVPTDTSRTQQETILCPHCGEVNSPQNRFCAGCHQQMPYNRLLEAFMDKEVQWATMETGLCLVVLAAVLWAFSTLPIDIKGALVFSTVIVGGWRFLKAIGPRSL